jgi:acyl-CoA dehydrogenase
VGFAISNIVKSKVLGITAAKFASSPFKDETKTYYQSLAAFSANLAMLSDLCMALLGGELKRKERISARLGDLLSYLYLGSATLKRFDDEGRLQEDLPLVHWAMQDTLHQMENAMVDLLDNFPNKYVGKVLKFMTMPWGRRHAKPGDKLEHKISVMLQSDNSARTRLGHGQYLAPTANNAVGKMEQTLKDILNSEPLFDRVCKAANQKFPFMQLNLVADKGLELGVLNEQEAALMRRAEKGRLEVINVDDFRPEELMAGISKEVVTAKAKAA